MSEINIELKLYGILKSYAPNGESLSIRIPESSTLANITKALYMAIQKHKPELANEKLEQLLDSVAFAKDDQILAQGNQQLQLKQNDIIAVLPPVCGG